MTMVWSSVKEQVFRLERDTLVSAGAGSGKTAALVELYLRLVLGESSLDRPLEPSEIIAITFTDKAAQEMRERIRAGMGSRLASRHDPVPPRLLEELSSAPIATFHSFCARLLRENTVAAGVDPRFTVMDAFAASAEREGAMADLLREELAGEAPELSLVLHHISLEGGDHEPSLARILGMIQEQGDAEPSWYDSAAESPHLREDEGLALWAASVATFDRQMAQVTRILGGKPLVFHTALAELPALWARTPSDLRDPGIPGHLARLGACLGGNWGKEKEVKDQLVEALDSLKEAWAQVASTPVLLALLALGRRFARHYGNRKSRRGVLDFEDLQVKARDLLRGSPQVRQAVQASCRVVLVDEFQDTNPLQKEIVDLLCGPEQRLFVVGDPKQSIYLFRGADVTVFNLMGEEMRQRGGDLLYFQESFRSRQGIIDLVNDLFGRIMTGGDGDFCTRFGAGDRLEPVRHDWDGTPCAELLTLPGKEKGDEGIRQEADAVAERILSLVDGRQPVQVWRRGSGGSPPVAESPCYGDMAILFRRFSHLKIFEESLRRRHIPYHVVKGRGFYQCQEIMDILSFLRYLDSSCDLVALAGLLRSPLCGVSDDTLYLLSRHEGGIGAWEELLPGDNDTPLPLWERIEEEDRRRLADRQRLLTRLRPVRDRLTVAELLDEIVSATLFTVILLGLFQGAQKVANVRKLLDLARSFHQRGDGTLRQFIVWLQRLVDQEPTEAEALLAIEGENAVALMTVHQSKGLEFPVVFIPECGAPLRSRNEPLIVHPREGLALRLRQAVGEGIPSLAHRRFAALSQRKEEAETQRLFYVAMTRARDYLVLSGESSQRSGSWRAWLDDYLASGETPLLARREVLAQPALGPPPPPALEAPPPTAAELERAMARAIDFRPPPPSLVVFSPTALEDFRLCPRKYYYKAVLGLDEGLFAQLLGVRGPSPALGTGGLSPLDKGTLAHRILQSLEFGADPGSWLQTAARCIETFPLDVPAADRAEVEQRVTAFASSPLGRSLAGQGLRRELPFLLRLDGAAEYHLTGAMDLVAEGEEKVTVIDYKYAAGAKGVPEGYRFQVGAYMLALSRAYPDREIGGRLVFLGDGEVLPVEVDLPRFEAELVAIMDRIRGLRDEEDFTPLPGCDGATCPFRERCFSLPP